MIGLITPLPSLIVFVLIAARAIEIKQSLDVGISMSQALSNPYSSALFIRSIMFSNVSLGLTPKEIPISTAFRTIATSHA